MREPFHSVTPRYQYCARAVLRQSNSMSSPVPENMKSPGESGSSAARLEMASVLFMDIVGYSLESMEQQSSLLGELQNIVKGTVEFQRAQQRNLLISLPTGDGMALVFFDNPLIPVECAVSVCTALKNRPGLKLRMGVHTGPVYRIADINANMNVAGGGINMAQRVMDCGDAGHILLSSAVADVLRHLSSWAEYLTDLGEHQVKHGVKMHIYALCTPDVSNQEIPAKLRVNTAKPAYAPRRKALSAGLFTALVVLLAGAAFMFSGKSGPPEVARSAAAPVVDHSLAYWLTVQKYKDGKPSREPFRLAKDINFESDYRIRLGFSSPDPGYLYLINEGPVRRNGLPDYHILFPSPVVNDGSPEVHANIPVQIPPEGKSMIRFDDQQGTEKLWIVWTKQEPPELVGAKQAASFLPEHGGSIQDPARVASLQAFLAKHATPPPRLEEDEARKQTILRSSGDVLVYLRKLEHH
jgi:class 3 adenylate cyclase